MSDNLAKFINDAVEFIGGGALVLAAIGLLARASGWDPVVNLHLGALGALPAALTVTVGIAVAYIFGISSESLSRGLAEWDLHRISLRHQAFWRPDVPGEPVTGADQFQEPRRSAAYRWWAGKRFWYLGRRADQSPFTRDDLKRVIDTRERMRSIAAGEGHGGDIASQLKRLRLERMTCLAGAIAELGLLVKLFHHDSQPPSVSSMLLAVVGVGLLVQLVMLVHVRLGRYCESISRSYFLAAPDGATRASRHARAVVFDLDGVLVDSEPTWQGAFCSVATRWLSEHGYQGPMPTLAEMKRFQGGRVNDTIRRVITAKMPDAELDDEEIAELTREVVGHVIEAFASDPVPIERNVLLARQLAADGVALAVASSSAREFIDVALTAIGLDDVVAVRESALHLDHGKPHPEVYERALLQLGVPPVDALAVEDSSTGVISSLRAGMRTVWYLGGDRSTLEARPRLTEALLDHGCSPYLVSGVVLTTRTLTIEQFDRLGVGGGVR